MVAMAREQSLRSVVLRCLQTFGFLVLSLSALVGSTATARDAALPDAVAGSHRTPANVQRDKYRHPVEALEFFGIRSDMTVVEMWAEGGWWTEILAPYLRDEKHFRATFRQPAI